METNLEKINDSVKHISNTIWWVGFLFTVGATHYIFNGLPLLDTIGYLIVYYVCWPFFLGMKFFS